MSVVGFDIGNENCVIAVAKHSGIDVLLNDDAKRETPAVVSFGKKQRFLGSAGAELATTNPKTTISQIKRLIGRLYEDPSVQEELRLLPFETSEGPRGGILIHLEYLGKKCTFMPVEILGMLFSHLKQMTEKNLGSPVVDCVIGIPSYFTDLQRREYVNAASIAGLSPLRLIHDCTAVALGYGMYKTDFSNKGPTNVMFVDIGQCDTQVTVAAFEKGRMTVLSHSFDQHLGGRDFDEVLFKHLAAQFKEKYDIDVYSNAGACVRLRASCEKLKKVLSANAVAELSLECLIHDIDLNGFIKRRKFEDLSGALLERVTDACRKAVKDSGLSEDKIHTIELVGSGSRIPAIMRKLTSVFGKEPMKTLNGSECVARGCALYCAMLSPTLRVSDYKVKDIFPYSVGLCFNDGVNRRHSESTPFPKGSPFPSTKTVSHNGNTTFCCQLFYNKMDFLSGISSIVGRFRIGSYETSGAKIVEATVDVHLNVHGIVEIEYASFLEDSHPLLDNSSLPWLMNTMTNSLTKNDTANHAVEARGSRARRQMLAVSENYHVLTMVDEISEAQKTEQMLAEHDIKVEKTKEKRNTLESFIYDTRSKLLESYRSVATDSEVQIISITLQQTEDWLREDGDDESAIVYSGKLEELKKFMDPFENRYKDENARKEATIALQTCIQENRVAADLLPLSEKKEVNNECAQAEEWLNHLSELQDSLAKNTTRIYCLNAIAGITQAYDTRCKVIMRSKPASLPKYDEPVDLDREKNLDDMQADK